MELLSLGAAARHTAFVAQVDVSALVNRKAVARIMCGFRMLAHTRRGHIRYEDFTECYALWCEEEPDASSSVYNTVSQHMESLITVRPVLLHSLDFPR